MSGRSPLAARVRRAMAETPRVRYLPREQQSNAHLDTPLPIGHGATNSQPSTVAYMLALLDARPGQRVLDVGSGSGWTTDLLARLVGAGGRVRGVELEPALVAFGSARLESAWASIWGAVPGRLGLPDEAPFDRILVSADPGTIPDELAAQLGVGGRMVLPADGRMWVVSRTPHGFTTHRAPGLFRFVPLR